MTQTKSLHKEETEIKLEFKVRIEYYSMIDHKENEK